MPVPYIRPSLRPRAAQVALATLLLTLVAARVWAALAAAVEDVKATGAQRRSRLCRRGCLLGQA